MMMVMSYFTIPLFIYSGSCSYSQLALLCGVGRLHARFLMIWGAGGGEADVHNITYILMTLLHAQLSWYWQDFSLSMVSQLLQCASTPTCHRDSGVPGARIGPIRRETCLWR